MKQITVIGFLGFKSDTGNLKTTDQLTGYSAKVHSTNGYYVMHRFVHSVTLGGA